ncbi:phosphatase PAP2 family protein [Mucilaginibacter lutimaris]|uniref:Phosphatase PAP2 family protein n=1 Tax=Mucilaginibacter lutimaris TaxID=931629 RepID=A0ABW2ZM35_9SPHI
MKKVLFLGLWFIAFNAGAQTVPADTGKKVNIVDTLKKDLFTAPDTVKHLRSKTAALIPPAILVGYGLSSLALKPLQRFDRYVYQEANEHNFSTTKHYEDYFQYAPVVMVYAVNLVGVHGKNTFVDRTLIYVMAQGMMNAAVFGLKNITHRLRPNGSDRHSFPSGHTSNSFLGAEFMAQELNEKSVYYGIIGYTFATTTGLFRIYHQNHWFSDVVAGAGFGILSTKAAYLIYPHIRNKLFKSGRDKERNRDVPTELKKENKSSSILLPSYQGGVVGFQFAMQF